MKLNHKIQIDLLEVFKSGKFEFIKPGQARGWILNNFPDPDDYTAGETLLTSDIWRYGNIEFHFHEDRLIHIFTDYITSLDGGENIEIKKWILEESVPLTVQFVTQRLISERISFLIRHHGGNICETSIGLPASCVDLHFAPAERDVADFAPWHEFDRKLIDPNDHELYSITLKSRDEFEVAYNIKL